MCTASPVKLFHDVEVAKENDYLLFIREIVLCSVMSFIIHKCFIILKSNVLLYSSLKTKYVYHFSLEKEDEIETAFMKNIQCFMNLIKKLNNDLIKKRGTSKRLLD